MLELKPDLPSRHQPLLENLSWLLRSVDNRRYMSAPVDRSLLAMAEKLLPGIRRGLMCRHCFSGQIGTATRLGCALIVFDYRLLSPQKIEKARSAGLEVSAYTTNSNARTRELRGWGVDNVITGYPIRYYNLQHESEQPPPVNWMLDGTIMPFNAATVRY